MWFTCYCYLRHDRGSLWLLFSFWLFVILVFVHLQSHCPCLYTSRSWKRPPSCGLFGCEWFEPTYYCRDVRYHARAVSCVWFELWDKAFLWGTGPSLDNASSLRLGSVFGQVHCKNDHGLYSPAPGTRALFVFLCALCSSSSVPFSPFGRSLYSAFSVNTTRNFELCRSMEIRAYEFFSIDLLDSSPPPSFAIRYYTHPPQRLQRLHPSSLLGASSKFLTKSD